MYVCMYIYNADDVKHADPCFIILSMMRLAHSFFVTWMMILMMGFVYEEIRMNEYKSTCDIVCWFRGRQYVNCGYSIQFIERMFNINMHHPMHDLSSVS